MPSSSRRAGPAPRRVFDLVVVAALALVACVVGLVAVLDARIGAPTRRAPAAASGRDAGAATVRQALRLLQEWDEDRAAAYARGSTRELRGLYVAGSAAGVADVRLLARYRSRALRVVAMRTQVLSVRVLDEEPDRWRLEVTDRLAHAEARRSGSLRGVTVVLPRDLPTTRVVTLVRSAGAWRVLSVTDS